MVTVNKESWRDGVVIFIFFNGFLLLGYCIFKSLETALVTRDKWVALINLALFLILEFALFIYSVEEYGEDDG